MQPIPYNPNPQYNQLQSIPPQTQYAMQQPQVIIQPQPQVIVQPQPQVVVQPVVMQPNANYDNNLREQLLMEQAIRNDEYYQYERNKQLKQERDAATCCMAAACCLACCIASAEMAK